MFEFVISGGLRGVNGSVLATSRLVKVLSNKLIIIILSYGEKHFTTNRL